MKYSQLYFCLFFVLSMNSVSAQQLPLRTQYRAAYGILNPGALSDYFLTRGHDRYFGLYVREQWNKSFPGNPKSGFFSMEFLNEDFDKKLNFSWGANFTYQNNAPIEASGAYLRAVVRKKLGSTLQQGSISFGFNFGSNFYRVNTNKLNPFHINDKVLTGNIHNQFAPGVGYGIFAHKEITDFRLFKRKKENPYFSNGDGGGGDIVYIGLSNPQIMGWSTTFETPENMFTITQYRHLYGFLGYIAKKEGYGFWELSLLGKKVPGAPFHGDVNCRRLFKWGDNTTIWLETGLTFSNLKMIHYDAGVSFGRDNKFILSVGGGFSLNTAGSKYASTELSLAYSFLRRGS